MVIGRIGGEGGAREAPRNRIPWDIDGAMSGKTHGRDNAFCREASLRRGCVRGFAVACSVRRHRLSGLSGGGLKTALRDNAAQRRVGRHPPEPPERWGIDC